MFWHYPRANRNASLYSVKPGRLFEMTLQKKYAFYKAY